MLTRLPVIASHVDCSLRNLKAILLAGGERDHEIVIDGYVWSNRAPEQVKKGVLREMRDSAGKIVCYRRLREKSKPYADPAKTWQKTPSGNSGVHVMQLKEGRKGRSVPATQRPGVFGMSAAAVAGASAR